MTTVQALTRDGTPWAPQYLDSIDPEVCIGCGRCFKVCAQGVLAMQGLTEEGDFCEVDHEDMERIVATVADGGKCIGCGACGRVCAKGTQTFVGAH